MSRPKRADGIISDEWPEKINGFFAAHSNLKVKGVAFYLSDIAREEGLSSVTSQALYVYRNTRKRRNPPERFKHLWEIFMQRLEALESERIALRESKGQHILAIVEGQPETIWFPESSDWSLHRCDECKVLFVGQWNAKTCPACR